MRENEEAESAEASGNTDRFRAFVGKYGDPDTTQPWSMRADRQRVLLLAGTVVAVAFVLALIALFVAS